VSRKIITLPNSHLREKSHKIGIVTDDVRRLIEDMKEATLKWEAGRDHEVGVALAAVQVDELVRIIVVRNDCNDKKNLEFTSFINPVIVKRQGELVEDFEGCLSVPDIYGKVSRYGKVKVRATDENGQQFRISADGFLARIFQHEIDHLQGVLFIDRIKENSDAFFQLTAEGKLEQLNYEEDVRNNSILW